MRKTIALVVLATACGTQGPDPEAGVVAEIHDSVAGDLTALVEAAYAL